MARKKRGEFVFSAFSSFLLAWPVRRLVMHDRCRYVYSVGRTRSGAKASSERRVLFASLRSPNLPRGKSIGLRFTFVSVFPVCSFLRARNPENWTERSVPTRYPSTSVLQMNDQLEASGDHGWTGQRRNFKNHRFSPVVNSAV